MNADHIEPDGPNLEWSDGRWAFVRVPARGTPHPELLITPFVTDNKFTITHEASGLRVIDCSTIDEGLAICQSLAGVSFNDPGEPGSNKRAELLRQVKRALIQP